MMKRLLTQEFEYAHRSPFLNLLHEGWTTGSGKTGVVGTSVSFIDKTWNYRSIALLVTMNNGTHDACKVKKLITSRVEELYDIDIETMAQFTMSDTAPAAHKISKLFVDSIQTDCTMHVLNLCLVYGLGMREHMETVYMVDPDTGAKRKERRVCTVGGPFPEGAALIKKVRGLNNYFNSPQRVGRLTKVQQFYGLPELSPTMDCDTRVASTVTLFQRTIVNYLAFKAYFQYYEAYDDERVFSKLSMADWKLMTEVEAVTGSLADLARIEVQRSDQVASELIVLLKFTVDRLSSNHYLVFELEALRTPKTNEASLRRHGVQVGAFSAEAQVCIDRIKGQVEKRIATLTAESVVIMLLDPRTKFSIDTLVRTCAATASDDSIHAAEVDGVVEEGRRLLRVAHQEVFRATHAAAVNNNDDAEMDMLPNLDLAPSVDGEKVICGAMITSNEERVPASTLREQADDVLRQWHQYTVQWVSVAMHQTSDDKLTADDFTRLLLLRHNGEVCWNLQALCKHIDICRWYRETGALLFPSIAALARVWLGRSPSNAFQERVFSTGGFVMSSLRTRTDNERAEMQVLMKHNRSEIRKMEMVDECVEIFSDADIAKAA